MGRPRKPTAILEMNGAFRKNPARARSRASVPKVQNEIGDPPECFTLPGMERHLSVWHEIVAQVPERVLTFSDRIIVEMAVRALYKVRTGTAKAEDKTMLKSCLVELGMTPVARERINVPKEKNNAENPWKRLSEDTA